MPKPLHNLHIKNCHLTTTIASLPVSTTEPHLWCGKRCLQHPKQLTRECVCIPLGQLVYLVSDLGNMGVCASFIVGGG